MVSRRCDHLRLIYIGPCGESMYHTENDTAVSLCDCVPTNGSCAPTAAPSHAPTSAPSVTATQLASSDSSGLSTGGKVGVGVGVGALLLLAAGAVAFASKTSPAPLEEVTTGLETDWTASPQRGASAGSAQRVVTGV